MAALDADIVTTIAKEVEQMVVKAQADSEVKIRRELNNTRSQLQQMESMVGELAQHVTNCASRNTMAAMESSQVVDRVFLNQMIAQLEQKWSTEAKALKQDLHRTILAHNHNSDLMRHHRDALDEARKNLDKNLHPKAEQVDAQIEKVDRNLRQVHSRQRAVEALTERLGALEQQVEFMQIDQTPSESYGMFPPGMFGGLGMPPGMMEKEKAPASKKGAKKEEPATEGDIRAKLLGMRLGQTATSGSTSFNTSAPEFVPHVMGSLESGREKGLMPMKLAVPPGLGNSDEDSEEADAVGISGATKA